MRTGQTAYIIAYDVASDARRRQIAQTLESFGKRVQYSVFRCALSEVQRARLVAMLTQAMRPSEDQVILIRLGKVGSRREWPVSVLGRTLEDPERSAHIIS